jgi:hypothetical protein
MSVHVALTCHMHCTLQGVSKGAKPVALGSFYTNIIMLPNTAVARQGMAQGSSEVAMWKVQDPHQQEGDILFAWGQR